MVVKKGVLTMAVASLLFMPVKANAAGNVSEIEQKWLDFQKAVHERMIKEGKLSLRESNKWLAEVERKAQQSEDDIIYDRFANRLKPMGDNPKDHQTRLMKEYAALTDRTTEEVKQACEKANMTVWELAASEGKLDNLKLHLAQGIQKHLKSRVHNGTLTQKQADDKLGELQRKLDKLI